LYWCSANGRDGTRVSRGLARAPSGALSAWSKGAQCGPSVRALPGTAARGRRSQAKGAFARCALFVAGRCKWCSRLVPELAK
jgi:hypothetical protein